MITKIFVGLFLLYSLPVISDEAIKINAHSGSDLEIKYSIKNLTSLSFSLLNTKLPWVYEARSTISFSGYGITSKIKRVQELEQNYPQATLKMWKINIKPSEKLEGSIKLDSIFPELNNSGKYSEVNIFWTYFINICEINRGYINTGIARLHEGKIRILFQNTEEILGDSVNNTCK